MSNTGKPPYLPCDHFGRLNIFGRLAQDSNFNSHPFQDCLCMLETFESLQQLCKVPAGKMLSCCTEEVMLIFFCIMFLISLPKTLIPSSYSNLLLACLCFSPASFYKVMIICTSCQFKAFFYWFLLTLMWPVLLSTCSNRVLYFGLGNWLECTGYHGQSRHMSAKTTHCDQCVLELVTGYNHPS